MKKTETKYYYIHGLHGSKNSIKFIELKKQYPNIECLEWGVDDVVNKFLLKWSTQIENDGYDNVCVIASSTGANFAVILRNMLQHKKYIRLVLINPLLSWSSLFDKTIMPDNISPFITKIVLLNDSLILLGGKDTVVDNINYLSSESGFFIKNNNQIVVDPNSTHDFENLSDYYPLIYNMVNSIHL